MELEQRFNQGSLIASRPREQTEPDVVKDSPQKAELWQQISRLKAEAAERDAETARLRAEAAERDAETARLRAEFDAEAARLRAEFDAEAARLRAEVEIRDAEIQRHVAQLQMMAEQAAAAVERGEELAKRLEAQADAHYALQKLEALRINPYTLLQSRLRQVHDLSALVSSTSRSAQRVDIQTVLPMEGFKKRQRQFTQSVKGELEKREPILTIPEEVCDEEERTASSEGDLEKLLYMHVFLLINKLFDDVKAGSVSKAGCSEIRADGAAFLKLNRKLLLLLELKRHNLTAKGTDLARICQALLSHRGSEQYPKDCLDAIQQLAGYMTLGNVQYGILTTYEYWWLVELCSDGAVKISPPYHWMDEGECSVMAMLHYALSLARESACSRKVTLPQMSKVTKPTKRGDGGSDSSESRDKENKDSNGRQGGGGSKGGGASKQREGKSAGGGGRQQAAGGSGRGGVGRFEFVRYLVEHADRISFQARLDGCGGGEGPGRLVAVKAYDTAEARDREAARFRELRSLPAVPALLDGQLELEWTEAEERRVHALVLEWVGPPDAGGAQCAPAGGGRVGLPREALEQVRAALGAMHGLGVAHGDVRGPNLAWDPVARRAFVLDLSHAVAWGEAEFAAECRTDLQRVAELMEDEARARAGPPARLMR